MDQELPKDAAARPSLNGEASARPAALLDIRHKPSRGRAGGTFALTLGHADASIDCVALSLADTKKLLYAIAVALKYETLPYGPATEPQILSRWYIPHSLMRAQLNVRGHEAAALADLEKVWPELGDYIHEQLKTFRRVLAKKGSHAARPETIIHRIKQFVLVAVDTARLGT